MLFSPDYSLERLLFVLSHSRTMVRWKYAVIHEICVYNGVALKAKKA